MFLNDRWLPQIELKAYSGTPVSDRPVSEVSRVRVCEKYTNQVTTEPLETYNRRKM